MHWRYSDVQRMSSNRLSRNTTGIRSFEPLVPPMRLIAAFCRLDKPLSCCWEKGWLVGAVGIEPTTFGLKGRCSTTELRPYGMNFLF
jgi:hypothetical protein